MGESCRIEDPLVRKQGANGANSLSLIKHPVNGMCVILDKGVHHQTMEILLLVYVTVGVGMQAKEN